MAGGSMEDAAILVDRASSKLEKLAEARIKQEPVRAIDEMAAHIEEMDRRREGTGIKAISTGFDDLDKKLNGGLRRGELIVVAARPKMGKTAFSMNMANNIAVDHQRLGAFDGNAKSTDS